MKQICKGLGLFLSLGLFSSVTAWGECTHTVVNLRDSATQEEGQMVLMCNAGVNEIPERQNVLFVSWKNGELCTATKECTNIRGWTGKLEAEAQVYLETNLTIIPKLIAGKAKADLGKITFTTSFQDIKAGCSELKRECIPF